jgi:hypothetical protein
VEVGAAFMEYLKQAQRPQSNFLRITFANWFKFLHLQHQQLFYHTSFSLQQS